MNFRKMGSDKLLNVLERVLVPQLHKQERGDRTSTCGLYTNHRKISQQVGR
jgi:hypothetical protein